MNLSGNPPVVYSPSSCYGTLSFYRTVTFHEKVRAMVRVETYNAFNHTQFSGINSTAQFNSAGQQVNAARPPRILRLGLRLTF